MQSRAKREGRDPGRKRPALDDSGIPQRTRKQRKANAAFLWTGARQAPFEAFPWWKE